MIKCHLSRIMGEKRITQKEVIETTGLSSATISNLYNEKVKRLDFDTLEKLCKLFNCNVQEIFFFLKKKHFEKKQQQNFKTHKTLLLLEY